MKTQTEKVYIKSLPEYIDQILSKKECFKPVSEVWFRGQGSDRFQLIPNLFRKALDFDNRKNNALINTNTLYKIEQNIDVLFSRKATMFFNKNGIQDTHWNRYFLKQHYQVHTRLLDWTENALIALFFALADQNLKDRDAQVFLLAPFSLNNYTIKKLSIDSKINYYHIPSCGDLPKKSSLFNDRDQIKYNELLRKYYRLDVEEEEELYPLAIYPQHLDARMSAQQACFTMFGNVANGFDINDSKELITDSIFIAASNKQKILAELGSIGINYYTIFPDLDGLGKSINDNCISWFENSKSIDFNLNLISSLNT